MNKFLHQYSINQYLLIVLLLSTFNVFALPSNHFVSTWTTTSSGFSHVVTIPTKSGLTYNYSIDWDNDGVFDEFNVTGDATHSYGLPGAKTIRIVGTFPRLFINNGAQRLKIKSIDQWGTNPWTSMRNAFYGAESLENNASDTPNLSNVQHLHAMFRGAVNIGEGSANWAWTTTGVTDMSNMFQNTAFDKYIGSWDTASVTTFKEMFFGATSYDKGISNWNVEASTDFTDMFLGVTFSTGNYEALLISWANQNINNALSFNGGFSKYCSNEARTARNSLIFGDGLSITDFGLCDEGYFVTTWKTDNPGTSNSTSITIPTQPSGIYNYQVDWNGDGDFNDADENNNYTGNATHDYGVAGTHTIRIKGIFSQIYFDNSGDKEKILSIDQWGTKAWTSMSQAFQGASNLIINATDTPDLSSGPDMWNMFRGANNLGNGTGNWNWNTSSIQSMNGIFADASSFNKDISNWATNNVTNMQNMFEDAISFDQDLSTWNVESVNVSFLSFLNNTAFSTTNYDALLVAWSSQNLFSNLSFTLGTQYCSQAAQNARASIIANNGWTIDDGGLDPACDTSVASNHFVIKFDTTIAGSTDSVSFEIPTTGTGYNYSIDSNNNGTFNFTGRTGNATLIYVTGGIKTIRIVGDFPRIYFNNSGDKDKILSIEQWGTNPWISMNNAFSGASNLVINATDTPDLSNATSLFEMFEGASNLGNGNGNWNWDTSNITGMSQTFKDAVAFDEDISSWNVENVDNFGAMFAGATLSNANYDALLVSWDTQNVNSGMGFNGGNSQYCSQAATDARANLIANDGWTISDGGFNLACNTGAASDHFVITFDTSIAGSTGSTSFNIPTTGSGYNYNIDSNNDGIFDITGKTGDTQINWGLPGIKTIRISGDFPRIYFNNSGDKDKILSIDQWGTNQWTSMESAFQGTSNLIINATDTPDLSICGTLSTMFNSATNIGNGTANWDWDTSNIVNMASMFASATSFDEDISSWNIENATTFISMFHSVTLSPANYDALLISWDAQNVQPNTIFGGGSSQYCSQAAQDARANLIATDGWTITDGGQFCDDIFKDGFDTVVVKTAELQVNYDFSKISMEELEEIPRLIIKGIDAENTDNMRIHIRNNLGVLQVRVSYLNGEQWAAQQWLDVDNDKTITLQW